MKKSRTIYCDGVHLWRRLQPLELNPATSNWQLWPIAQLPNSVHCLQALYAAPTQSTSFVRCTHTVYKLCTLYPHSLQALYAVPTLSTSFVRCTHTVYKLCTLYPHCLQALYAVPRLSTSLKAPSPWLWVPRGPDFPLLRDPFHKADAPYIPLPPTHPWQERTLQKPTPKKQLDKSHWNDRRLKTAGVGAGCLHPVPLWTTAPAGHTLVKLVSIMITVWERVIHAIMGKTSN